MDDVIVIILTLIFIVASIFGQKKKRQPLPEAEQQSTGENFWDMLDEEWNEMKTANKPQQQKPVQKQETNMPGSTSYAFRPEDEGPKFVAPTPEKPATTVPIAKKKKFPLREAVIYSEILNRKYI